ncbi:MAG: hypothetical protein JO040_01990 [Gemmatimonadetes bacterium]|nr:hypothetical protein [Gemmatimonadota bacterium]
MRTLRTLALGITIALAACSPDAPTAAPTAPTRAVAAAAGPLCLEFNVPPLGTPYGAAYGTPVGAPQWVENGITAAVVPYQPGALFVEAKIDIPPTPFGAGAAPTGRARSISWQFDFTGLPFIPKAVTFDWLDQGSPSPVENLAVNGSPLYIGQLHTPPASMAGIAVGSSVTPAPGGLTGTVKMSGPVQKVIVGGQPVWIDHVCAYP